MASVNQTHLQLGPHIHEHPPGGSPEERTKPFRQRPQKQFLAIAGQLINMLH